MNDERKIDALHRRISAELEEIANRFSCEVKLTLVVRTPQYPDGGFLFGDDDMDLAIETIRRLRDRDKYGRPRSVSVEDEIFSPSEPFDKPRR